VEPILYMYLWFSIVIRILQIQEKNGIKVVRLSSIFGLKFLSRSIKIIEIVATDGERTFAKISMIEIFTKAFLPHSSEAKFNRIRGSGDKGYVDVEM